jgi:hypothetical protein
VKQYASEQTTKFLKSETLTMEAFDFEILDDSSKSPYDVMMARNREQRLPPSWDIEEHYKMQETWVLHFRKDRPGLKNISEYAKRVKELDPSHPDCCWVRVVESPSGA